MKFIVQKIPFIFISTIEIKSPFSFSSIFIHLTHVFISIGPPNSPVSLKLSISEISVIILLVSSGQSSFAVVGVISPISLIHYLFSHWVNYNSVDFHIIFILSFVDQSINEIMISEAIFLVILILSNKKVVFFEFKHHKAM